VPPNGKSEEVTFLLPFDCRIHFIGTHIHPHGESIELFNVTRQERVWKGVRASKATWSKRETPSDSLASTATPR